MVHATGWQPRRRLLDGELVTPSVCWLCGRASGEGDRCYSVLRSDRRPQRDLTTTLGDFHRAMLLRESLVKLLAYAGRHRAATGAAAGRHPDGSAPRA